MSPTLTDASAVAGSASDGLAVLEQRGSTAEAFGIPLAVLAELTHRCPLQCPYCSNPVELERGGSELIDHRFDAADAVAELKHFHRDLVRRQYAFRCEDDPDLPCLVELQPCMPGQKRPARLADTDVAAA